MDITFIQTIWTAVAFVTFISIVIWTFSSAQKKGFEEASRLPLEDEMPIIEDKVKEDEMPTTENKVKEKDNV